jgi:hypothetical protein
MAKKITIDGTAYTVPDDATLDEVSQIAKPPGVPGAKQTGLPPAGAPPSLGASGKDTPAAMKPTPDNFMTSPNGLIRSGVRQAVGGVEHMAQPGRAAKFAGGSDVIRGLTSAATPAAIPFMVAAPVASLGALAGGAVAGTGTEAAMSHFGASPEASRFGGDLAAIPGAAMGGSGASSLFRRGAGALAENAVGIRAPDRAFGATPGKAILEETKGFNPATIADSANTRIGQLGNEVTTAAANAGPISLKPARGIVSNAITSAQAGNSQPRALFPIQEHLSTPHPGFAGAIDNSVTPPQIAEDQPALNFLGMKRRLATDFSSFNPRTSTDESVALANQVHHQMGQDFNSAVPGGEALNQRIQSLIPVAQRAKMKALNGGIIDQTVDQATRPTGGLFGPIFAAEHGGPVAGAGVLAAQRLLGSPTARMAGARGIFAGAKRNPMFPKLVAGEESR